MKILLPLKLNLESAYPLKSANVPMKNTAPKDVIKLFLKNLPMWFSCQTYL